MIFNVLLLSLSLVGSAVALPSPVSSVDVLAARNIDPAGPIPADAVPIPGGFSFEADSDTAHWVRAQVSTTATSLSKRESSGLNFAVWTGFGCSGSGAFFNNLQYGVQSVGPSTYYQSIQWGGRSLFGNEQLDFSQLNFLGGDKCADYQKSAPNGQGSGCHDEGAFSCIRLLKF